MSTKTFIQLTVVAISLPLAALVIAFSLLAAEPAHAAPPARPLYAICQVTTTADSGAGSLRTCLQSLGAGDTITFNPATFLPGSPATISVLSELPHIYTDSVTIDGSNAGVILDGSALSGASGLSVDGADNVVIKGLQVLNFPNGGISINSQPGNEAINNVIGGTNSTPDTGCSGDCNLVSGNGFAGIHINDAWSTIVTGNFVGTNAGGTAARGNDMGIYIGLGAAYNTIGGNTANKRNLISGNTGHGVSFFGSGTDNNTVIGNYIGTDISGTSAIPNGDTGVSLSNGAKLNVIGGDTTGERNLISGNDMIGVGIWGPGTMYNTVSGNYIGIDVNGTNALGNNWSGVSIGDGAQYNLIGGNTPGERNLISGNSLGGVLIQESGTMSNTVSGNYIGTDVSGTAAIANIGHGVDIHNGATYNTIGGSTPGERNLISGNDGDGVSIHESGTNHNAVSGNYIGTNLNGTAAIPNNDSGVSIYKGAYNTIGGNTPSQRNLISSNNDIGIEIDSAHYNTVSGNYIGTNAAGTAGLGNGWNGVKIDHGASHNLIGGDTSGEGNLISGNACSGVHIDDNGTNYNLVSGNYIGTNASGTGSIGQGGGNCDNDGVSIRFGASYNVIGGDTPGERNIISGNGTHGVRIEGNGAMSNTVSGNYIGTDVSGTIALSNSNEGVHIAAGATHNVIGGDTPGERNLISGNGSLGVQIFAAFGLPASYNTVVGNYIGTDVNGTNALGNGSTGVNISNGVAWGGGGVFYNRIGGSAPGEGNLISGNNGNGVWVWNSDTLYNTITQNSIHNNTGKGIELSDGGNTELPAPVIAYYDLATGTANGTACTLCTVEIFSDDEDEGRVYEGTVTATAAGEWSFSKGSPLTGPNVTATATDSQGNTSEFSAVPKIFQVDRDGFSFPNFRYYKTNGASWAHFKKTFPDTEMELPDSSHRRGPVRYFYSPLYQNVGNGGNCAGFTAVSLIRFLELAETVEPDLLSAPHRAITQVHDLPPVVNGHVVVGQSDVKDYIHLYQARQFSYQFYRWWVQHLNDTPLQTYQAIKAKTQVNEPVAVSIRYGRSGHRMTAYRTAENGNLGYIYVYDNNHPDDANRRIEINLQTGYWSYQLWPGYTWSGITNLRYSPGTTNFPAQLDPRYDVNTAMIFASEDQDDTLLNIEGEANLLITDEQGNKLGYENGSLVSNIPDGVYLYEEGFNPDAPDAQGVEGFLVPVGVVYTVTVQPLTNSGAYTLTAFAGGSALSLDNIDIITGTVDTLVLSNGVLSTTFTPATDADYCHYVTREPSAATTRDFTSCVSGATNQPAGFSLAPSGSEIVFKNQGGAPVDVTITAVTAESGQGESTEETQQQVQPGEEVTVQVDNNNVYLPIILKNN